ncbi:LysM peptidoglycan-binding domain-containing protein [uncultured Mucilaginibacter sp.]|uniref:LysM peptidoglycan-binding domain-containing protein n=1 Tax=uncultured Mucilaginibacter sp. TaxID=797541 RepID=UPI00262D4389|nr:LysM peptidoglycan-binding domain-containing protein [uncultured Mucilaginibacter sp.]
MIKIKNLAVVLLLSSFCSPLFARTLTDSVGVENQNGKMVILHKLDPKDNYYSIARRYNVRPKEVMDYNNNAKMQIGAIIKVPTDRPFNSNFTSVKTVSPANQPNIKSAQNAAANITTSNTSASANPEYTQYKVSQGETLYAISKRFQVKVDDIIAWNNLKSNNLNAGQMLQIKREEPKPAVTAPPVINTTPAETSATVVKDNTMKRDSTRVIGSDSSGSNRRLPNNRYGLTEKNEKGTAVWINDPNLDPKKKYVLHRTAPVGTIIKITNPNTNRTTFAKVVGSFTENETNKDAIVVMTKDVAESLGAIDKRFYVNLSYGSPNP